MTLRNQKFETSVIAAIAPWLLDLIMNGSPELKTLVNGVGKLVPVANPSSGHFQYYHMELTFSPEDRKITVKVRRRIPGVSIPERACTEQIDRIYAEYMPILREQGYQIEVSHR